MCVIMRRRDLFLSHHLLVLAMMAVSHGGSREDDGRKSLPRRIFGPDAPQAALAVVTTPDNVPCVQDSPEGWHLPVPKLIIEYPLNSALLTGSLIAAAFKGLRGEPALLPLQISLAALILLLLQVMLLSGRQRPSAAW